MRENKVQATLFGKVHLTLVAGVTQMTSRFWCATLNNPTDEEVDRWMVNGDWNANLNYFCVGYEEGEEGTTHLQIFLQTLNPIRWRGVQTLIVREDPERVHVEQMRGTAEQARAYICDDEKPGSHGWREYGVFPEHGQGARNDILECKRMLDNGDGMLDVAEQHFGTWVHAHKAFEKYQTLKRSVMIPTWRNVRVIVYWGQTGSGKTRKACSENENAYILRASNHGVWFDGYNGQDVLILDDFSGWIPLNLLLNVLDGYRLQVEVKGGTTIAAWTTVILTSNTAPSQWYSQEAQARHPGALERRINEIWFFSLERGETKTREDSF